MTTRRVSEPFGRELDTAKLRRSHNIPGHANHEQITEALIEDDLHGHA
jgi:hypothetical protein